LYTSPARPRSIAASVAMRAADAVLAGDGGDRARSIPRPLHGAAAVAGALGRSTAGRLVNVVALDVAGGVQAVRAILNPDRLGHLGPVCALGLRPSARSIP
jgi:RNA polymerase sigma-70 factor (ECF subfamily)